MSHPSHVSRRVIDTYLTSNRQHVLLVFDDGTWRTYKIVTPRPRTWREWLRKLVGVSL